MPTRPPLITRIHVPINIRRLGIDVGIGVSRLRQPQQSVLNSGAYQRLQLPTFASLLRFELFGFERRQRFGGDFLYFL